MKNKLIAFIMTAVLALGLSACGSEQVQESVVPQGTAVEVITVDRGDIFTESKVTGNVMANRDMPVIPKVACKVKTVNVKAGQTVKEGDVLFTLDTDDVRDLYGTLLESYNGTKSLLDEQVRQSQQTVNNLAALYEMGAVSKNQLEQAQLGLLQAQTSRKTSLAQLGADDVLEVLEDPNVTAPISGTVTSIGVSEGVMVTNSNVAAVVSEIGRPQAVVNVSEVLQPHIRVGDKVDVHISSLGDEPVTGTVASVASAISTSTALYPVRIDLPASVKASVGMFATVTFRTDARYDAVLVPTEAILNDGEEQYVFAVSDGAAIRVVVTTGLIGETETEITTGLQGGEQIVTRGQSLLTDGAPVRITGGTGK